MARLSQTERKAMIRAFGITAALFDLSGLDYNGIPESFPDKATFQSAHRLFTAGVEAKRTGRAITRTERGSDTFMVGYRLAAGTVNPSAAPEGVVGAPSGGGPAPNRPPFEIADNAVAKAWGAHWIIRDGDTVQLYEEQRKKWVLVMTRNTPPSAESPEWHNVMYEGTEWLSGSNVKDDAVIRDFAERLYDEGDASVFEPNPEDHSQAAKLRAEIAAGRVAFLAGSRRTRHCTLAWALGYDMAEKLGSRRAS